MSRTKQFIDVKEIHQFTFDELYKAKRNEVKMIFYRWHRSKPKETRQKPKPYLKALHVKQILKAIEENKPIRIEVLEEYQFYKATALSIKKYCRARKIQLS